MDLPFTLIGWIMFAGVIAIITLTAYGLRFGINYAQANIKNVMFDQLCRWARTYVTALAQDPSLKGLASEEKKERAMVWLMNKAAALGVEISHQEASRLIEEAVYLIKQVGLPELGEALEPEG